MEKLELTEFISPKEFKSKVRSLPRARFRKEEIWSDSYGRKIEVKKVKAGAIIYIADGVWIHAHPLKELSKTFENSEPDLALFVKSDAMLKIINVSEDKNQVSRIVLYGHSEKPEFEVTQEFELVLTKESQ